MKGVVRLERKDKFKQRYIGPLDILRTVLEVAYKLSIPKGFSIIHLVFHVFMLQQNIINKSLVIQWTRFI